MKNLKKKKINIKMREANSTFKNKTVIKNKTKTKNQQQKQQKKNKKMIIINKVGA